MNNLVYKAAYTSEKLCNENKLLNIPIYQRLFVWEEEQINLLLQDLEETFKNSPRISIEIYYNYIGKILKL